MQDYSLWADVWLLAQYLPAVIDALILLVTLVIFLALIILKA
jgi:hypothetical protein